MFLLVSAVLVALIALAGEFIRMHRRDSAWQRAARQNVSTTYDAILTVADLEALDRPAASHKQWPSPPRSSSASA